MKWYLVITSIGSTIFKTDEDPYKYSKSITETNGIWVYDPCMVVQRPQIFYGLESEEFRTVYSKEEAMKIQFMVNDEELKEVEGPLIDDYIPIYKEKNPDKTVMLFNLSSSIFIGDVHNQEEMTQYIDFLLGRTEYKTVENTNLSEATLHDK